MSIKTANAIWHGSLTGGSGHLKTESGKVDTDYAWKSRAEDGKGTNPEELIGAAHAGCFSMALAHALAEAGHEAKEIKTEAKVHFGEQDSGFAITKIVLHVQATVPGMDEAEFDKHAEATKTGCPVSKALSATPLELNTSLSS